MWQSIITIIKGMTVLELFTGVLAFATIALVISTIVYTVVSWKIYKGASKQIEVLSEITQAIEGSYQKTALQQLKSDRQRPFL